MSSGFKDHFSAQSTHYQRFRPCYPDALFRWLAQLTPQHQLAWDCATGNGQAARALAHHYDHVLATDASANQIAQCQAHPHIEYRLARAEQAPLANARVDLITVAQALHWFDQTAFFQEAWRVLRPGGVLALWNYNLLAINPQIDAIVKHFYHEIVGPYWPPERRLIEQGYAPIPAPFTEIPVPAFAMTAQWSLADLLGYLGTWSASVYYQQATGHDPLTQIQDTLSRAWENPNQLMHVSWPIQIRVSSKQKESP